MTHQYVPLRAGEAPRTLANRRASFRYGCPPAMPVQVHLSAPASEPIRGWALDLSTKGIGICMPGPIEAGAFGVIRIKTADRKRIFELAARVIHSHLQANGDWLVGFEFVTPLDQGDLDDLL